MVKNKIDFKIVNAQVSSRITELLPEWLPGGKQIGRNYRCADIYGGDGSSFSVNTHTGYWKDFACNEHRGSDFISLYAQIKQISQYEAATQLKLQYGESHAI